MKSIIFFLGLLFLSTTMLAQSGKLSIRMYGIICHQQTADNILGMDGVGDEIFLWFYHGVNKSANTIAPVRNIGSPTFAEKTSLMSSNDFYAREKAGTASVNGGFKTGDTYIINDLRYIIQNEAITTSTVVFISPSIWEYDKEVEYPFPSAAFASTTKNALGTIFFQEQVRNTLTNFNYNGIDNNNYMLAGNNLGLGNQYLNIFKPFAGKQCSLPIGMNTNHEFSSIVIALNSRIVSILATKDYGYGQGIIPVLFSDVSLGNNANHGVYSVLLKVEFTADATAPAPPPPPTQPTTTQLPVTNKKDFGIIENTTTTQTTIAGTWVGTWGSRNDNSPNFYSFRLNADGTMQLIDSKGNITASGSYSFSKSQLAGSYTYLNADTYSFAATMDASNIMNGSWGQGSNSTNGGKWTMRKK
jgi:hypothetical protein